MDVNNDGVISLEEFMETCIKVLYTRTQETRPLQRDRATLHFMWKSC